MSLADRFKTPSADPAKQFCTVGRLLDELVESGTEYAAVVNALQDGSRWSATAISQILNQEGHRVNIRHIREHRNGNHTIDNCKHPQDGVLG